MYCILIRVMKMLYNINRGSHEIYNVSIPFFGFQTYLHFNVLRHAPVQVPAFGGHEIYNFKRPFLGYYFIISLFYVCFGIENNILMQFHLCLKGQCNSMRTPVPEVIKFKILEFPSSIIITTVYVQFVRSTLGRRDEVLKGNNEFSLYDL